MVTDMILGNPGKVDCSPFSIKHRFSGNFGTYFGHNYIFYKKNHVFVIQTSVVSNIVQN